MAFDPDSPPRLPREKTDDELKQLAIDVYSGHVFCDWMINPGNPEAAAADLRMVFMVLALMSQEQAEEWIEKSEPSMLYEYMEKAGPRSVNGMPGFFSMQSLNRADHAAWVEIYNAYLKTMQDFLEDDDGG